MTDSTPIELIPFDRSTGSATRAAADRRVPRGLLALGMIALFFPMVCGCVQRRMTIRSNPPGALVYVDDYEIGLTPVSVNFTYYGTRKIRLVKDGFETLTVMEKIPAPWYQIPPLDFVAENLVPGEIRDRRTLTYQLRPQTVCPPEELLARAEQLRNQMYVDHMGNPPPVLAPSGGGAPGPVPSWAPDYPSPYGGPAHGDTGPLPPTYSPYPAPAEYPDYPMTDGTGGSQVYPLPSGQ